MRAGREGVNGSSRACSRWPSSQASSAVNDVSMKPSAPTSAFRRWSTYFLFHASISAMFQPRERVPAGVCAQCRGRIRTPEPEAGGMVCLTSVGGLSTATGRPELRVAASVFSRPRPASNVRCQIFCGMLRCIRDFSRVSAGLVVVTDREIKITRTRADTTMTLLLGEV